LEHLTEIFDRIRQAGLKLKPTKCNFASASVNYLGHVVSKTGVSVDPAKIQLVAEFPTPKNQHDVRSFIGLANYYRRFVKNLSNIATPLNDLLKADQPFRWTEEAEQAFQQLKKALTSAPILAYPDFQRQFILYTDASNKALGYVLGQRDDQGRERVIAYGGRALRGAKLNYGITEKETLALVDGVKNFKVYLSHAKFLVYTDHSAIKFLNSTRDPTGRLGRWSLFLQAFDFEIVHKARRIHTNADALSRMTHQQEVKAEEEHYDPPTPSIRAMSEVRQLERTLEEEIPRVCAIEKIDNPDLSDRQRKDAQAAPFIKYLEEELLPEDNKIARRLILEAQDYVMENGILYHLYYPRGKGHRLERTVRQSQRDFSNHDRQGLLRTDYLPLRCAGSPAFRQGTELP
jgi:hypothetical protein